MFKTYLSADLPSEETEGTLAADRFGTSHDRVTFSAPRLLSTLQQVFEQARVTDLTYVVIDDKVIYRDDTDAHRGDIDQILSTAKDEGFFERPFQDLRMGLAHWEEGLQHIIEAHARMEVPVGEHELQITFASRPDDFNARRLDDADRYAQRLLDFATDAALMARYRDATQGVVDRVVSALRVKLFRREVVARRTQLEIVRPTRSDLESMERLVFGERIQPPKYRLSPPKSSIHAAWDDIFVHVYDDPFLVFRHWVFLNALLGANALRFEWVWVIEPDGKTLFQGHKAKWFENWPWGKKFEVEFLDNAGVKVHFHEA
jgi:hypothetical protein